MHPETPNHERPAPPLPSLAPGARPCGLEARKVVATTTGPGVAPPLTPDPTLRADCWPKQGERAQRGLRNRHEGPCWGLQVLPKALKMRTCHIYDELSMVEVSQIFGVGVHTDLLCRTGAECT